jgi:hypothetical protein
LGQSRSLQFNNPLSLLALPDLPVKFVCDMKLAIWSQYKNFQEEISKKLSRTYVKWIAGEMAARPAGANQRQAASYLIWPSSSHSRPIVPGRQV